MHWREGWCASLGSGFLGGGVYGFSGVVGLQQPAAPPHPLSGTTSVCQPSNTPPPLDRFREFHPLHISKNDKPPNGRPPR